jgi:hypothetical protein
MVAACRQFRSRLLPKASNGMIVPPEELRAAGRDWSAGRALGLPRSGKHDGDFGPGVLGPAVADSRDELPIANGFEGGLVESGVG